MPAALLSSLSYAIANITDALLIGDCYNHRRSQPLFISCVLGAIMGSALTIVLMRVYDVPLTPIFQTGLWSCVLGVMVGLSLLHYFTAFSSSEKSPTEIAAYISATPIAVLVVSWVVFAAGIPMAGNDFSLQQVLWVLLGGIGLMLFSIANGKFSDSKDVNTLHRSRRYRLHLFLLLLWGGIYYVGFSIVLQYAQTSFVGESNPELLATLSVLPYFWVGLLLVGLADMIRPGEASAFVTNAHTIKRYFPYIILVEVFGMLVFFFEILALSFIRPEIVSIVVGGHIVLVWMVGILLRRLYRNMKTVTFNIEEAFPATERPLLQTSSLILIIGALWFL